MITEQDRQKYKNYTDDAILGLKLIEGLQNNVLRELSKEYQKEYFDTMVEEYKESDKESDKYFNAMILLMGEKTNPNWIMGRVVDEMYARDMIDKLEYDRLSRLSS